MSKFDPKYMAQFYDAYGERESERWDRGSRAAMQHAIFCKHLHDRVRPGMKVLDAGSGPGMFAKVVMNIGASVTCLDISEVQLQACRENAPCCDSYELGSVTDLSRFPDDSFDIALALGGVLSYCFEQAPVAVQELVRVTRPGGWLGLSVMNFFGTVHTFLPGVLEIAPAVNREILATGDLKRDENNGHECHLFRVDEIQNLLFEAGLTDIELHANGWLVPDDKANVPDVGSQQWAFLFEAEFEASRESPGAGTHIIAWGRRPA